MASVEVMTACENVCRDFSTWFPSFAAVSADLGTFLVGVAAVGAFFQFKTWRKQRLLEKREEIGSELLALTMALRDLITGFRLPIGDMSDPAQWEIIRKYKVGQLKQDPDLVFRFARTFQHLELLMPASAGVERELSEKCRELHAIYKECEASFNLFSGSPQLVREVPESYPSRVKDELERLRRYYEIHGSSDDIEDEVRDLESSIKAALSSFLTYK